MIQFANPVWLWGLLGLLIPVSIHLLSRKEGKVIPIGSLRHLKESDTAQFSSIRLNEILLLLLRCLLITLVVLMLAGAAIRQTTSSEKKWLVVERGIERERMAATLIDSLSAQGYELRRLTKDFPLLEDTLHNDETIPDYWALAEALAAKPWNDIIVLSYNYVEGFNGKRQSMPDNIRWITYEPAPATFVAKAIALANDSVWVRTAQTSAEATMLNTTLERTAANAMTVDQVDTIKVSLFYDLQFDRDAKIIEACLGAVQTVSPYKIIIDKKTTAQYKPTSNSWTIWLADQVPPAIQTPLIVYSACAGNLQPVMLRGEQARVLCNAAAGNPDWMITRRLTEGLALDENLSLTLASILLSDRYMVDDEKDKRQLAGKATWSATTEKEIRQADVASTPLESFLAIVLLLCLAAERWLAFNRNQ
ncbi:BatA domain-containing protein [Fulvivirgaceae bacterium PWU4]|uniref:BatA domain-containing protein n=1 Tax=Chryseosolibacter histidini TaxID=2782349 RepID=A0AAP2DN72_9BACT|nr:BatA domain-containing protein [Chryseosolibacter histidini]MBT1699386.1 BatA domain-containing protein [Chryseosolibacter histidini]